MTPTQRTIRELKNNGRVCAIVEKWNPHVGPHGIRQDLFGIIDVLALDPQTGVVGIQCCGGSGYQPHLRKICSERAEESLAWLSTPGTGLELWCWRKVKLRRGGKAVVWRPRIKNITQEDIR